MPTPHDSNFAYVRRQIRTGARATLPSRYNLGDALIGEGGAITVEWVEYDASETSLTKRIGMPLGRKTADAGSSDGVVTGDRSATDFKCTHILTAVPTATNKYVLAARVDNCDLEALTAAVGSTVSLTTDGTVGEGDGFMWIDDDLVISTAMAAGAAKYPGFHKAFDMGVALADDSSTTLTKAKLRTHIKTPLPDKNKVSYFVQDINGATTGLVLSGDSGCTLVASYVDSATLETINKLTLLTDSTADDEASAATGAEQFKFVTAKRFAIRGHVTFITLNTNDEAGFFGVTDTITDIIADSTGALGAAAAFKGCGFYFIDGELKIHHAASDGTTLDTNTAEDLHTYANGDEVQLLMRGLGATSMSISSFVNGTAAGTALTLAIAAAAEMHGGLYLKGIPGTTGASARIRDVEIAFER